MTAISRALSRATGQLSKTSDTPRLDAELLMAAALTITRDRLLLQNPNGQAPDAFFEFIERRAKGEPVAYLTGQKAFWTIDLAVGPGALVRHRDGLAGPVSHRCLINISEPTRLSLIAFAVLGL